MEEIKTKRCARDGKILPITEFNKHGDRDYQSWCKSCANEFSKLNKLYMFNGGAKICKECKRILPRATAFSKTELNTRDGYLPYCKECAGEPKEGEIFNLQPKSKTLNLDCIPDVDLIQALKARGYKGTLTKEMEI